MRPLRFVSIASAVVLILATFSVGPAVGSPMAASITLDPEVGPPTAKVMVSGSGFSAVESVVVRFDATKLGSATTDGTGSFSKVVNVPAVSTPGAHVVKATGKSSGLSATASFMVRTDWAKYHFDNANSGYNPYENVLDPSNVPSLSLVWTKNPYGTWTSGSVAGGVLYIGQWGGGIIAVKAATGKKVWTRKLPDHASTPAVANGVVYIGTGTHCAVDALDAATGQELWIHNLGLRNCGVSSPAVVDGVVYVGHAWSNGGVHALDATTGDELWSYTTAAGVSSAAVAKGVVYVGSGDGNVFALDATTGAELWSYTTAAGVSSAAVAKGVVYVGSGDGNVFALDATTGAELWSYATGAGLSSPAVAKGVVYGLAQANPTTWKVYALDAATGNERWSVANGCYLNEGCGGDVAVANGVVYLEPGGAMAGSFLALDAATGSVLWQYTAPGQGYSPIVTDGMVFMFTIYSSSVYAFALP